MFSFLISCPEQRLWSQMTLRAKKRTLLMSPGTALTRVLEPFISSPDVVTVELAVEMHETGS